MTKSLIVLPMLLIVPGASTACFLGTGAAIGAYGKRHGTMPPPIIGALRDA